MCLYIICLVSNATVFSVKPSRFLAVSLSTNSLSLTDVLKRIRPRSDFLSRKSVIDNQFVNHDTARSAE